MINKKRVKRRILESGHNIPANVIERRYLNGIKNLFDIYLPIVNGAQIVDNSDGASELFACCESGIIQVINKEKFREIREYYEKSKQKISTVVGTADLTTTNKKNS